MSSGSRSSVEKMRGVKALGLRGGEEGSWLAMQLVPAADDTGVGSGEETGKEEELMACILDGEEKEEEDKQTLFRDCLGEERAEAETA